MPAFDLSWSSWLLFVVVEPDDESLESLPVWPYWMLDVDEANAAKWQEPMVKKGMKIGELSPSERRRWAVQMPSIAREWADQLERDGHPGRKLVKAYLDEVRAFNVEVARHWDRE